MKMCKYCEVLDCGGENIRYDEEVEIQIMDDVLYIETYQPPIKIEIEIQYCPMCGTKL